MCLEGVERIAKRQSWQVSYEDKLKIPRRIKFSIRRTLLRWLEILFWAPPTLFHGTFQGDWIFSSARIANIRFVDVKSCGRKLWDRWRLQLLSLPRNHWQCFMMCEANVTENFPLLSTPFRILMAFASWNFHCRGRQWKLIEFNACHNSRWA